MYNFFLVMLIFNNVKYTCVNLHDNNCIKYFKNHKKIAPVQLSTILQFCFLTISIHLPFPFSAFSSSCVEQNLNHFVWTDKNSNILNIFAVTYYPQIDHIWSLTEHLLEHTDTHCSLPVSYWQLPVTRWPLHFAYWLHGSPTDHI